MLESTAIVPAAEIDQSHGLPRHPWTCRRPTKGGGKCNVRNLARDASCRNCGAPYAPESTPSWEPDPTLAGRVTIRQAVEEWATLETEIRMCFARLDAVESRLSFLFSDEDSTLKLRNSRDRALIDEGVDSVVERTKRQIWASIVDKLEVRRFVSDTRWREISDQLEKGALPDLTVEAIEAWRTSIMGSMDSLLREKVTEVFDYLRPRHDHHKTNSPFELGRKVILTHCVEKHDPRWSWKPRLDYRWHQMFSSIESLFRTLDGKGTGTAHSQSDVQMAIAKCDPETGLCETEYFKIRACRNGNCHLEFRRMDLVEKLNRIAGGKNLRGRRVK